MRLTLFFAPLVALALLANPSFASDEAARKEAEAQFEQGLALHDAGNDEQARFKFVQAYALVPSPLILFNVARSEQLSNHAVDAMNHYRVFLRAADNPKVTPDMRAKAQAAVEQLVRVVAQVKIEASRGAKIAIDGNVIDAVSLEPIAVTPGHHAVEARLGSDVERLEVDAIVGDTIPVRFRAESSAPSVPSAPSWSAGKTATVISLSVVAASAIATSVAFFIGAANRADDLARLKTQNPNCAGVATQGCQDLSDAADARVQDRTAAYLFLGAGAAAALGAVAAALLWRSEDAPKQGLVPLVSPRSAGVGVLTHF